MNTVKTPVCVVSENGNGVFSVYEKLQAKRAKVAPVNLIYGSHFSATEATYKVSQNIKHIYIVVYTFSPF